MQRRPAVAVWSPTQRGSKFSASGKVGGPRLGHTGLVLTGGGARAAYQVGVLRALSEIAPPGGLPFDVLAGISAGAINSIALATAAEDFQDASRRLSATWAALTPDRIFQTGTLRL